MKNKKSNLSLVINIFIGLTVYIFVYFTLYKITNNNNVIMNLLASVMITIILLYYLNASYKSYTNAELNEPWIVETTKNCQKMTVFPGNDILVSKDSKYGIEFSYSTWIYINDWTSTSNYSTSEQHVFHKGSQSGVPDQCPGVWLDPTKNEIIVKMTTFISEIPTGCDQAHDTELCYLERFNIPNIPINKWFQLTMCVINRNLDIYINGFLKKRCILTQLPKQNYGDIYINAFNGFNGYISKLRYYNYSLPVWRIEQIFNDGPSDVPCVDTGDMPPYLAKDWWMNN